MKKNKNLKLLRAWFSFLARYTRKKKSLWCMAAILLVIGIAAAQNADRHEIIRIGLYCANPDEMTEAVLTNLESLDDGLYRFYRSSSLDYMQEDINLILSYKKWDLIATHNPFGEYGKFLHKTISQMVTQCYNKMTNKSATLYYFGRYYNSSNKIPGEQIAPELLAIKNSMVGRYYPTAKGAIDAFGHMIPYENWLLPSEW